MKKITEVTCHIGEHCCEHFSAGYSGNCLKFLANYEEVESCEYRSSFAAVKKNKAFKTIWKIYSSWMTLHSNAKTTWKDEGRTITTIERVYDTRWDCPIVQALACLEGQHA